MLLQMGKCVPKAQKNCKQRTKLLQRQGRGCTICELENKLDTVQFVNWREENETAS